MTQGIADGVHAIASAPSDTAAAATTAAATAATSTAATAATADAPAAEGEDGRRSVGNPPSIGAMRMLRSFSDPSSRNAATAACTLPVTTEPAHLHSSAGAPSLASPAALKRKASSLSSNNLVMDAERQRAHDLLQRHTIVTGDAAGYVSLWHVREKAPIRTTNAHESPVVALLPLSAAPTPRSPPSSAAPSHAARAAVAVATPSAESPSLPADSAPGSAGAPPSLRAAKERWQRSAAAAATGEAVRGGVSRADPRLSALLVTACHEGHVKVWDTSGYKFMPLGAFQVEERGVTCAALRCTQTILLGFDHGAVQLWRLPELPTPQLFPDLADPAAQRERMEASWQLAPALCLGSAEPHAARVSSLSCAADGRIFLSASPSDHTVALWSLADFTPLRTFVFNQPPYHAVCLDPPTGFLAALGDSVEHVPLPDDTLPAPVDADAMDAALALLAATAATRPRRGGRHKPLKEVGAAGIAQLLCGSSGGATGGARAGASVVGSAVGDEELWAALDLAEALRAGYGDDDDDDEGEEEEEAAAAAAEAAAERGGAGERAAASADGGAKGKQRRPTAGRASARPARRSGGSRGVSRHPGVGKEGALSFVAGPVSVSSRPPTAVGSLDEVTIRMQKALLSLATKASEASLPPPPRPPPPQVLVAQSAPFIPPPSSLLGTYPAKLGLLLRAMKQSGAPYASPSADLARAESLARPRLPRSSSSEPHRPSTSDVALRPPPAGAPRPAGSVPPPPTALTPALPLPAPTRLKPSAAAARSPHSRNTRSRGGARPSAPDAAWWGGADPLGVPGPIPDPNCRRIVTTSAMPSSPEQPAAADGEVVRAPAALGGAVEADAAGGTGALAVCLERTDSTGSVEGEAMASPEAASPSDRSAELTAPPGANATTASWLADLVAELVSAVVHRASEPRPRRPRDAACAPSASPTTEVRIEHAEGAAAAAEGAAAAAEGAAAAAEPISAHHGAAAAASVAHGVVVEVSSPVAEPRARPQALDARSLEAANARLHNAVISHHYLDYPGRGLNVMSHVYRREGAAPTSSALAAGSPPLARPFTTPAESLPQAATASPSTFAAAQLAAESSAAAEGLQPLVSAEVY